ncbi:hypothetical protein OC844_007463, partial [Tilletia horrida]
AGKHQYSQACLDDIWTAKVLTKQTWRTLCAARLVNRFGGRESFTGADLYLEHLNKEIQRFDITHGADKAVQRLRDRFSANCETARSMRRAHHDLLGTSGRNWKEDDKFSSDIRVLSDLAGQDELLDSVSYRLSDQTCRDQLAQKTRAGPILPSTDDILDDIFTPSYGEDVLEKGLVYMRSAGISRWQAMRSPWQRYDDLLAESIGQQVSANIEDTQAQTTPLLTQHADTLEFGLDDARRAELEREWDERRFDRRARHLEAEGLEQEDDNDIELFRDNQSIVSN